MGQCISDSACDKVALNECLWSKAKPVVQVDIPESYDDERLQSVVDGSGLVGDDGELDSIPPHFLGTRC